MPARSPLRHAGPVLAALAAAGVLAFAWDAWSDRAHAAARESWGLRLQARANDRAQAVDRWVHAALDDARLLASFPAPADVVAGAGGSHAAAHAQLILDRVVATGRYSVRLVRADGTLAAAALLPGVDGACPLDPRVEPAARVHAHPDGNVFVAFAAPVSRGAGTAGWVMVEQAARRWLYPFLAADLEPAPSLETLLVAGDGGEALFLTPLRRRPGPSLSHGRPTGGTRVLARAALDRDTTFDEATDYSGTAVLAATERLGEVPWAVVAKVDSAEAYADVRRQLARDGVAALLALVALGGLLVALRHTMRLRDQAEIRKLSRAVEQSPASIVITDRDGAIEYVNPRFVEVSGYSAEEVLGRNPRILKSGVTPEETYREMWAALAAGGQWRGRLCNRRKSGDLFWEDVTISGLRGTDGGVTHYVAVKEDVTERQRTEQALEDARSQNLQSQKLEAIGQLAGGVAHDFNNVLGVIVGYGDMLRRSLGDGHPGLPRLAQMLKAADRASALTRQLLAFSRRQRLEPRPVHLASLVEDVRSMLERLIGEHIRLRTSASGDGVVRVDPGQMEQVLLNLVVNARDAMPAGGRIDIRTFDTRIAAARPGIPDPVAPGDYVVLEVRDEGHGMDAATASRIFEPFFTTKPEGKGTGLGLATVYGIVRQSGGAIHVTSAVGQGATFAVYLPRIGEQAEREEERPVPGSAPRGGGETVLLVEDQDALREVLRETLEHLGYRTVTAATPEEGLSQLATADPPPRLLVTDVVMPGMHGTELARRAVEMRPGLRVIYISGYTADALAAAGLGAHERLLLKPFGPAALGKEIRAALGTSEAEAAGR